MIGGVRKALKKSRSKFNLKTKFLMSTATTTTATEVATNIFNFISGHRSWGPLTITWHMDANYPLVVLTVALDGKTIGIGHLDGRSDIIPISYSFKGAAGGGIDSSSANGTLILDMGKKEITFDVTVHFLVQIHQKGVLFGY
jgi:hypothetical protein